MSVTRVLFPPDKLKWLCEVIYPCLSLSSTLQSGWLIIASWQALRLEFKEHHPCTNIINLSRNVTHKGKSLIYKIAQTESVKKQLNTIQTQTHIQLVYIKIITQAKSKIYSSIQEPFFWCLHKSMPLPNQKDVPVIQRWRPGNK